ncbi:MAG: di-trans,poly-cis-decaprenylcistransferase [Nonomuraea sp.]|nr:di-trans,poly-cis-decaprenylcistransferase [Nonomuraea sp.]
MGMIRALYLRKLRDKVGRAPLPAHVGLIMDGNRRWARQMGFDNPSLGHEHGVAHIETVLGWCARLGIRQVTIYVASEDNVRKRESFQVRYYMELIERIIAGTLVESSPLWRIHVAGRLDTLPDSTAHALKLAQDATRGRDHDLTVAIGYDGRQEVVDAVRSLLLSRAGDSLEDVAESLSAESLDPYLYTAGRDDPDLIIRTSGEQRMSGFLLWQAAHSELHFCDVYWPGFREIDFLRALRAHAQRRAG